MTSLFSESTDNEKIKAVYGNYCFWSWLRSWWLDTENYITWMLLDKGYYDYDYTEPKEHFIRRKTYEESVRSDSEVKDILSRFGWGKPKEEKHMTAEEMQRIAREEAGK